MANGQYGPSVHQMVKHKQHALVSGAPSSPSALRGLRAENGRRWHCGTVRVWLDRIGTTVSDRTIMDEVRPQK
ncbi:GL20443 [Drosophila persimilis]|uniref:GL13194 n=2 Tax=Drosophila persimilis TaxID=7234 RepID=B4HD99_DROPE|nr:GL25380 [Drosophila persimilis]EDW27926.1 GL16687 [Drosophila persimilis]EDW30223.1 GL13194 [Drosophila persimilis]EDW33130.1 GL22386 [Drosophila persimilis]EDW36504.1 GL15288 [Drosophila persimilis]